ncbi:zinc-ribbon domain-containing protein [Pyxidicoccus parkwayensis]|uniref:Zinc-ribbon domain-containing protein n=1 Tax=Pyxidicoccus parkwayensis TaxID=2813578 RepID=A0ABX7PAH1_9BACT|nr:tetratricopeptide repeat protein [Pyxidicoccus parkwaysis]QSQ27442.1 zinc-ribbon domain-containing protein [Pyxidicoccus parkwaysis]
MRIVCQKCAAAYAIDDRLITAKGVRAQCPRCRHLQLVRRDSTAAPAAGAPAPTPQPAAPATPSPAAPEAAPSAPPPDDLFGDFGSPPPGASPSSAAAAAPRPAPQAPNRPVQAGPRPAQAAPAARPAQGGGSDLFGDFGSMPAPGPASAPPVDPFGAPGVAAPDAGAAGGDPLLDFLGPPPSAPSVPIARIPTAPGGVPMSVAPPGGAAAPRTAAPAGAPRPATVGCRSCGKPLTDSFDQALGICDDCRQRQPASAGAAPASAPTPAPTASEGMDFLPPLTTLEAGSAAASPVPPEPQPGSRASAAPALGAEPRSNSSPRIPISTDIIPDMGPEPRSGPRPAAPSLGAEPRSGARNSGISSVRTGTAQIQAVGGGSGRGRGVLVGALAVLLIGGGAGAWFLYSRHQEDVRRSAQPPAPPPVPEAVQAALSRWKLKYLEELTDDATSAGKLAEGQQQLARDERFAYAQAEASFQQALLLDPQSDDAIIGYAQALTLGRGAGMDDATFQEARSLVEAAQARSGHTPPLLLANANLMLTRSREPERMEQARKLAEELLAQPKATDAQKAEAHLVLGRAYLSTSRELARTHFDEAQKLAPDLKRVAYFRALAHESSGEYSLALETLRKRLAAKPDDWDSLAATSRIYQEVGEPGEARKLYEARVKAAPTELRALLPLAVLRYQSEDNPGAAVRELRALLKNRSRYESPEVAEVLVHLASAQRAANDADGAAKSAEEALQLVKGLPEAHLQVFLVALGRRDATRAREHFAGFQGRMDDAALEKVLEGRLLLLEKKPAEAVERFQEAVRLDSRRLDAQLLAGVASASAKRRDDAFRALNPALQSDPMRLAPRPVATRFWLRPRETLEGMEGAILALAEGPEDPSPLLYEGLLRFHQDALEAAERHFRSVLEVDTNNAGALAYRSLIALRRGNASEAKSLATRAVEGGRQQAIAHLSLGMALAESRQVEPAKRSLRDALQLAPGLLSAQARLAELEAPQRRDVARDTLVRVVGLDPSYLPAKRMLYQLER